MGNKIAEIRNKPDGKKEYVFQCPGCDKYHLFDDDKWNFNGDFGHPTITPGIIEGDDKYYCHSVVGNGFISFSKDCFHQLSGRTVELPDLSF